MPDDTNDDALIEAVARGIADADHKDHDYGMTADDAMDSPHGRACYITRATAALAALRAAGYEVNKAGAAAEEFVHYLNVEVDCAPKSLQRLGNWLSDVLDEDEWKTAERLLNGAVIACAAGYEVHGPDALAARLDRQYRAGAQAGFNAANADNPNEALARLTSRSAAEKGGPDA